MNNKQVTNLKIEEVLPNRFQPRIKFEEEALSELTSSIKEHGVIQPIIVRPLGDKYEIIAGERRYKASVLAGKSDIPAIVVDMNDKESAEIALIENVQRKDLTPIEEAISYKKILDMGYISQDKLAIKLGKTQSTIANKLRLLNLTEEVQESLLDGKISERHARSLLKLKDKKAQNNLLKRIIEERMTVRKTDEEIDNMNNTKDIEVLDFDFDNVVSNKIEEKDPLDKYESFYNIPTLPIIEDKEDEFIPNIPNVNESNKNEESNRPPNINETNLSVKEEIKPIPPIQNIESSFVNLAESSNNENSTQSVNPGFLDISKIETEAININQDKNKISLEDLLKSPEKTVSANSSFISQESKEEEIVESPLEFEEEPPKFNPSRFFTMVDEDESTTESGNAFEPKFNLPVENNSVFNNDSNLEEKPSILNNNEQGLQQLNLNNSNENNDNKNSNIFDNPIEPIEPIITNVLPDEDNIENNIEENNQSPYLDVKPIEPQYKPLYEETERDVELLDNNEEIDLKTVIKTIRNCSDTIEKYGYIVDTEEFDFEDMYQVIFKIQKKN
ncbi:MAG: ParB/RepB/Spo0J family partition protein [Bacilli bacterium]